ncbi:MAG TPA: hypothetical protein VI282_19480, partial [Verrucomicrobiae bacterium]
MKLFLMMVLGCVASTIVARAEQSGTSTNSSDIGQSEEQLWNWHVQNTDIVQYHPGFPSRYRGANSLS